MSRLFYQDRQVARSLANDARAVLKEIKCGSGAELQLLKAIEHLAEAVDKLADECEGLDYRGRDYKL